MQDLTGQTNSDSIDTTEWESVASELKNVVETFSALAGAGDLFQLNKAIGDANAYNFYSCTGTDAYTLAVIGTRPPPTQYVLGMVVRFRPQNANTGNVTINVAGLGAQSVRREDGVTQLQPGDLLSNRDAVCRYDGVNFILYTPFLASNPLVVLPKRYRYGLTLAEGASDTNRNTQVRMLAGGCRSFSDTFSIMVSSAITKDFSLAWATGSAGGFPGGATRAVNTWYRFYVIANTVSGEVDAGFDDSTTAVNLIAAANAGYGTGGVGEWVYRQLGWVRSQGTSNVTFQPFRNNASDPTLFLYSGPTDNPEAIEVAAQASGSSNVTVNAPPNCVAILGWQVYNNTGNNQGPLYARVTGTTAVSTPPSAGQGNIQCPFLIEGAASGGTVEAPTNSSSQVKVTQTQTTIVSSIWLNATGFRYEDANG